MSVNFNPIGYKSITKNGNEYQKSNICKTIGIAAAIGIGITAKKTHRPLGFYWSDVAINEMTQIFNHEIKFSDKIKKIIRTLDYCSDLFAIFAVGALIDRYINKKRAANADMYV